MSALVAVATPSLAAFVTHALQDPVRPQACGRSLVGALEAMLARPDLLNLRTTSHDFWATCIAFVSLHRSKLEREVTASHLRMCNCDLEDSPLSAACHGCDSVGSTTEIAEALLKLLCVCFERPKPRGAWPSCVDDLLPFGPKAAASALTYWLRATHSTTAIPVISALIFHAGPSFVDALLGRASRSFALRITKLLMQSVKSAVAAYKLAINSSYKCSPMDPSLRSALGDIVRISLLVECLTEGPQDSVQSTAALRTLAKGAEGQLSDALTLAARFFTAFGVRSDTFTRVALAISAEL